MKSTQKTTGFVRLRLCLFSLRAVLHRGSTNQLHSFCKAVLADWNASHQFFGTDRILTHERNLLLEVQSWSLLSPQIQTLFSTPLVCLSAERNTLTTIPSSTAFNSHIHLKKSLTIFCLFWSTRKWCFTYVLLSNSGCLCCDSRCSCLVIPHLSTRRPQCAPLPRTPAAHRQSALTCRMISQLLHISNYRLCVKTGRPVRFKAILFPHMLPASACLEFIYLFLPIFPQAEIFFICWVLIKLRDGICACL